MKTIFNTYIEVESQEQADRLKQVCIDNELKVFDDFEFKKLNRPYKYFEYFDGEFCNWLYPSEESIQITEPEWMELLKNK